MGTHRPIERLEGAHFTGGQFFDARSHARQFAGRTTLNSGSTSVVITTALVKSDSLIRMAMEVASIGVGINSGGTVVINSIVDSASFALAWATGVAVPWDVIVHWNIAGTSDH